MISNSRVAAWMVFIIASIFYAYQYILRVMPNIILDDIMTQFDIGAGIFGQFSGIYYIGYSLIHLPIGIMLDRYGPRKVMSGCILLTVVGMLPLILAQHWAYPLAGRFLVGVGSSAAILGLFKIIRMGFGEERFPRMLSFAVTIGLVGAIYGGAPVSYMRETLGYSAVVETFAVVGVVLAALTYWIVPEQECAPQKAVLADVKEVLSNVKVLMACAFAGMMVGPMEGFADVWGTAFLKQVYGFEPTLAASLPSLIFIGMCFGAPLISFIAEKAKSNLGTIVVAGLTMVASFVAILTGQLSAGAITFNFVLIGVCCGYQILAIYKVSTYAREEVAGLTTAVANMIIMIFGYVFHATMGNVITVMGGAGSSEALIYGVSVIPVALLIGSSGFLLLLSQERRSLKAEI